MELFLHIEGEEEPRLVEFTNTTTAEALILASGGKAEGDMIWVEDGDEPLDADTVLAEVGIGEHAHLHRGRCRRLKVTVRHNGEKEHLFPPSAKVERVLKWAVGKHGFDIPEDQVANLVLAVCGADHFLDRSIHIGSLPRPSDCALCLDLAPRDRFEG